MINSDVEEIEEEMVICVNIKNILEIMKGKMFLFKNIKIIDVVFCILWCFDCVVFFVYFFYLIILYF